MFCEFDAKRTENHSVHFVYVMLCTLITGDGGGYQYNSGPGKGTYSSNEGGGGGHGGKGGPSQRSRGAGGNYYDTVYKPVLPGSGGGGTSNAGDGGSAIKMDYAKVSVLS